MTEDMQYCGNCKKLFDRNDLTWINDNYGIPYKKVCDDCYSEVNEQIRNNDYGKDLSYYELWGDD